jgi:hypothetical protein
MSTSKQCDVPSCNQVMASSLDGESLCRQHFISFCHREIEKYDRLRRGRGLSTAEEDSIRQFVQECRCQAKEIESTTGQLDNLERARLLLIIEEANELAHQLRRSPRMMASIAIRLIWKKTLPDVIEEDTHTETLSRYGAALHCSYPAKVGEVLKITRCDTDRQVQGHVVWQHALGNGNFQIGIEFENCDNFWGINWTPVEEMESPFTRF